MAPQTAGAGLAVRHRTDPAKKAPAVTGAMCFSESFMVRSVFLVLLGVSNATRVPSRPFYIVRGRSAADYRSSPGSSVF
jgi:hypothetical protein